MAKEMVSELENRGIEIIHSEEQKRLKTKQSLGDYGTILKSRCLSQEFSGFSDAWIREKQSQLFHE